MELFEEIRREHEFGVGTIQGVPGGWGASADGASSAGKRRAAGEEEPGAEEAEAGAGYGIYQRGVGGGQAGPAEAAAHQSPDLRTDPDGISETSDWGIDGSPVCRAAEAGDGFHPTGDVRAAKLRWGQEAQIDWYEAVAELDGERQKLQVFCMRSMGSGGASIELILGRHNRHSWRLMSWVSAILRGSSGCCVMTT